MIADNPADNPANHPLLQDCHQSQNLRHPRSLKASLTMTKLSTSCHPDANKVVLTPVPMPHNKDNHTVQIQQIQHIRHIRSTPCQIWPPHQQTLLVSQARLKPFQETSQPTPATLRPTYQPTRPTILLEHSPCSPAQSRPHVRLHPNALKSTNPIHSTAPTLRSFNPS